MKKLHKSLRITRQESAFIDFAPVWVKIPLERLFQRDSKSPGPILHRTLHQNVQTLTFLQLAGDIMSGVLNDKVVNIPPDREPS